MSQLYCQVLSTQAMLTALGLGTSAVPAAATINWIIKDGLGMLGGVVYTSVISSFFDSDPKKYRFRAVVALQLATIMEMMTPLFPALFIPIASISNVGKCV